MSFRPVIISLVVLALAGLALAFAPTGTTARPDQGDARPFQLRDTGGNLVTDTSLRGQVVLLYFGYTFCPDVCPTELGYVARVLRALGDDAERITPLFVTVDPERDTPELLKGYAPLFHPRIRALTGSPEELAAVFKTFGVTARKVPGAGSHYLLDHSSSITVLDRQGRVAATIGSTDTIARSVTTLRDILRKP